MKEQVTETVKIFTSIHEEFERYKTTVSAVLGATNEKISDVKKDAAKYKDEDSFLKDRESKIYSEARKQILKADQTLHDAVCQHYAPMLQDHLKCNILRTPNEGLMKVLRDIKDLGISLNQFELEILLNQTEGDYLALKAVQAVAASMGYKISLPDTERFNDFISKLERIVRIPIMYAPMDYIHEATLVFPDRPIFSQNGEVAGTAGRPDSVYLIMRSGEFNGFTESLLNELKQWDESFVPSISELFPLEGLSEEAKREAEEVRKKYASRSIANAGRPFSPEDLTGQITRNQAEADRKAAEGLKHYF